MHKVLASLPCYIFTLIKMEMSKFLDALVGLFFGLGFSFRLCCYLVPLALKSYFHKGVKCMNTSTDTGFEPYRSLTAGSGMK